MWRGEKGMSDTMKRTTEYILDMPKIIVAVIPITELIIFFRLFSVERLFILCYLFIFFTIYGLTRILDKDKMYLVFSSFVLLAMGLIFRDKVLFLNMALAFLVLLMIYIMNIRVIKRIGWPVVALAEVLVWLYFWNMSKPVAVCLVLLTLFAIIELSKKQIGYYMPVVVILGITVMFLPAKDDPIQWTFIKNSVRKTITVVNYIGDEIEYQIGNIFKTNQDISGYADTGQLQGQIANSVREEMVYDIDGHTKAKSVYLKGASYSKIGTDGMSEKEAVDEYYNAWFIEYINALYHADMNEQEVACFNRVETGDILYRYMRTTDVICPQNTFFLAKIYDVDINNIEITEKDMKKRKKKDFEYRTQFLSIDYASPYFREMVQRQYDENGNYKYSGYEDYYVLMDYIRDVLNINMSIRIDKTRYDKIVAYLEKNNPMNPSNGYLDDSMATDRIRKLTEELTSDAEGDFEKAKRIETFLRQYTYDRNTDLRGSDNFVDEFVFDIQRGYCVHYASSMVLMLRSCGIPARYSNGFLHKYKSKDSVEPNNLIMSDEAHAWPEAYIEGVGWIPFEPTTVMGRAEESAWGLTVSEEGDEALEGYASDSDAAYLKRVDKVLSPDDIPEQYKRYMQNNGEPSTYTDIGRNEKNSGRNIALRILYYTAMMIGTVLVILLMIIIVRVIWYHRLSPGKKIEENINHICKKLNKRNLDDIKIESIYDYLVLLDDEEAKEKLRDIFDRYYRVRFRGDEPESDFIKLTHNYRIS